MVERAAMGAARCLLEFLPVYSPDLNPIELVFASLKRGRSGGQGAVIGAGLD